MKTHPLILSADMVEAIENNNKFTIHKELPISLFEDYKKYDYAARYSLKPDLMKFKLSERSFLCSKCEYQIDDFFWLRQRWMPNPNPNGYPYLYYSEREMHGNIDEALWRQAVYFPREAANTWLKIINLDAYRLHDIKEQQAKATGVELIDGSYKAGYEKWWIAKYRKKSWKANPWVWEIQFARQRGNTPW